MPLPTPLTDEALASYLLAQVAEVDTDAEGEHIVADSVLCEVLTFLGYPKLVAAWNNLEKWYA